jgi:cadmium resistance protein CadD (predicted permease)
MGRTITAAIVAFISTNLDDLMLLLVWFGLARSPRQRGLILVGQYIGFLALVLLSLPGFFGGQFIDRDWLKWLGLLPIGLGIKTLLAQDDKDETPPLGKTIVAQVAAVTMANGADNIGIYVPFFAKQSSAIGLGTTIGIFILMVALWCGVALWLVEYPRLAPVIERYGKVGVPILLIGLGLYILMG